MRAEMDIRKYAKAEVFLQRRAGNFKLDGEREHTLNLGF